MAESVTVRAPGKVNLFLAVGPKRPDGFHDLATVFQAIGVYDTITASAAPAGISLTMSHLGEDLPTDDRNLAVQAARLIAERANVDLRERGVRLSIDKHIPVAGGMAGGSADAAGTLVALNELWRKPLAPHALMDIAAELGSDVPFCLMGGTAIGYGRGEVLSPVLARGQHCYLITTMIDGLSTPDVFREFDALNPNPQPAPEVSPTLLHALAQGDTALVAYAFRNDLMTPALNLHRGARHVIEFFCNHSLTVMVSGSGPTLIAQVDSFERGQVLAERLATWPHVADAFVAYGPVPGIELVRTSRRAGSSPPFGKDHPNDDGPNHDDLTVHDPIDDDANAYDPNAYDPNAYDTIDDYDFDDSIDVDGPLPPTEDLPTLFDEPTSEDLDESISRHPSSRPGVRPLLRVIEDPDDDANTATASDDANITPDKDS